MIKRIIHSIALKFYLIGKESYENIILEQKKVQLLKSAIIGVNSRLEGKALIQNSQNNAEKIKIGSNTSVQGHLMIFKHGGQIIIGDYSFVGPDTRIWSAKSIRIGNRVLISHNVNIHDNISHPLNSSLRHKDFVHIFNIGFQETNDLHEKEIIIEDDAWIGFNCSIMKGVRIGKGAIIGSGTLITHDIPPYAVVVGNPPRIIKYVD